MNQVQSRLVTKIQPVAVFILFLLSSNSLQAQWVNRFSGQGDFRDQFNAVITDASGNIFLAGSTENPGTNRDILVVKLNSSGDTVWTSTYNGPGNNADEAQAMAMDGAGNVYVTGYEKGALTGFDMITIKFNSSGVIQWTQSYLFVTDESDYGNSIAVDANGNVYVTGQSDSDPSLITNDDFITIKYNTNGVQQWAVRKNGSGNGIDRPSKIALDASGNAYVTGRSDNGSDDDYLTIKYNGSNGAQLWQQIVDRTHHDRSTDLVVNQTNGNVYVTGRSRNVNYDYVTVCYNSSGAQQWLSTYDNVEDDRATGIAIDGAGNLYVTGQSDLDPSANYNYDIVTVKYNSAGTQQWVKSFAGSASNDDIPTGIFVDASGNCFVTGSTDTDPGVNISNDYVSLGYNTSGTSLFTQTFSRLGNSNDAPTAITEDGSGNVIVTGSSESVPQKDGATLKYNSSGVVQWTKYYNGVGDNSENTHAIAIDANDNVFIAGYAVEYGMDRNFALCKLSAQSGLIRG